MPLGRRGRKGRNKELEGEITFWHSFTQGPRLETLQAAADAFMKDNPGVKINIETFSWADFYTKWTTGLASGNVPDMSTAQIGQAVEMMNAGAIRPMDGLIDRMGREAVWVDFNQGLDARLITQETATLLAGLRWIRFVRLSCDTSAMLPVIEQATAYLWEAGVAPWA